jgi:hypothetical protein
MNWASAIFGFLIGLAYAAIYLILAFMAAGAGHGTGIFFAAVGPYGLGLLVFPILGFLAGDLKPFLSKVLFISVLVIHYALVINLLRIDWMRDPAHIEKMWNLSVWNILLPAGFYLLGQVVIWAVIVRSLIRSGDTPPNNSFNASGNSSDVIRKVGCFSQFFPPG